MRPSQRSNIIGGIALTGMLLWVTNSAYADASALDVGYPYGDPSGSATPSDLSVHASSLYLSPDPVNGGYAGTLRAMVAYRSLNGHSVRIDVHTPRGLRIEAPIDPGLGKCVGYQELACYPITTEGERRTITIRYRSLAGPAAKTRYTEYGSIGLSLANAGGSVQDRDPSDNLARFRGKLPGLGWGTDRHPYQPAAQADAVLTTTGATTTTNNGDGTWTTNVPVAVTAKTDAVHETVNIRIAAPVPDLKKMTIAPESLCHATDPGKWSCSVPGGPMPQGATQQATLGVTTTSAPAAHSTVKLEVSENANGPDVPDRDPSNNVITVTR